MGLISKEAEIVLNPENIKRLELLGYEIPRYFNQDKKKMIYKRGTKIIIKVEDLLPTSPSLVKIECDYCGKSKEVKYKDYYSGLNSNSIIQKYCCIDCNYLKRREIIEYKQKNQLLRKGEKGYWTFHENRLNELKLYIEKYKTLHGIQTNKEGANLYSIFTEYRDNIENSCIELGYNYTDLLRFQREESYYDIYDNLKNDIEKLCIELGRFPKQQEVLSMLHIANERLLKFGGIRSIKLDMGYYDKNDLVDDRGFYNRSIIEYMTAQFLISYNIPYKREQYPFDKKYKNYRSDFTLYISNNKIIHVEVWGYLKNDFITKRGIAYNKKRLLKEKLYDEYNYILIGLDYEIFYKQNYKDVYSNLYNIFKDFIYLKYQSIKQEILIPPSKLSDKDLFIEIMKYSDNKNILPAQSILTKNKRSGLYLEVLNRYKSYYDFAQSFGKHTYYQFDKWNKDNIFPGFIYMINTYGHILKNNEYKQLSSKDKNITGFMEGIKKYFDTYIDARLYFYEYCLINNIFISQLEITYLNDLIDCKNGFNKKTATEIRQNKAKDILNKLSLGMIVNG